MKKKAKKSPETRFDGFHLVDGSSGIILNGIYIKDDGTELKILNAFGGTWEFRALKEGEISG